MNDRASLCEFLPRVRVSTRDPLSGHPIGVIVWVGSIARGWVGKPLNPRRWNETWRFGAAS